MDGRGIGHGRRRGGGRLVSIGQLILGAVVLALLVATIAQTSRTSRATAAAVRSTTGTETSMSLIVYTQRESLAAIVAVDRWLSGQATRREVQIARALLSRRLDTTNLDGATAAELAGPEFMQALERLDQSWVTEQPGLLPPDRRAAAVARTEPAIIDFTEQAKHLTDRYNAVAQEVLRTSAAEVERQNELENLLFVVTLALASILAVWFGNDVRKLYRSAADLQHRATHDSLTGLVNRAELLDRLHAALRMNGAAGDIGLLFIDLDGFKQINDDLGHKYGDHLLVAIGERLRSVVGEDPERTVGRLGGDEFVVLCCRVSSVAEVEHLADRLLMAIADPLHVDGVELVVSASIGISIDDPTSALPEQMMRHADVAMYRAKRSGPGTFCRYSVQLEHEVEELLREEPSRQRAFRDRAPMALPQVAPTD